jgi:hypothetical protein
MLNGPLTQRVRIRTKASTIFCGPAATTMVPTHAIPTGGGYLKIDVSGGTNNNGTVTITGAVGGTSTVETSTFMAARWNITTNSWDAGTPTITSSGLADEATKPTVVVDVCDAAGNKIEWEITKTYPARMRTVKGFGLSYMAQVKQQGLISPWMYEVFLPGNPVGVYEGQEFTVDNISGVFIIFGQIQQHQQIGTNAVDYVTFFATKRSD